MTSNQTIPIFIREYLQDLTFFQNVLEQYFELFPAFISVIYNSRSETTQFYQKINGQNVIATLYVINLDFFYNFRITGNSDVPKSVFGLSYRCILIIRIF